MEEERPQLSMVFIVSLFIGDSCAGILTDPNLEEVSIKNLWN
jgi:hypothetical protein